MFVIAKVVDGKIVDVYKNQVYKRDYNALDSLAAFHRHGMMMDYKVYSISVFAVDANE
ncbi:hypothetical protein PP657_gp093 [Bacillus phage BCPST]|uniref:Uncharacterized protein n=2 Tax=Yihwangvirus TaxID=3044863 RepID=A0AAE7TQQ6_9CAUD|nr:hypothetical protein PP655_gp101 [Bacillus phage PBC4]YP_010657364.1 hypothetical protein PP657_gp093 [Bacillus phage BCPST]AKQ08293.1 hypothetical protein PBC4_101 [Bacillus phage PBC4]QQO38729.1 hypothetical protein BCPST_111 [Bacillus phage BCPST]QSJ04314.1 hypothetical protein BCP6_110 [Bacillus phage BCP6]